MQEMEYFNNFEGVPSLKQPLILNQDTYKGFNYLIVNYGSHPCCYVEIPLGHPLYGKNVTSRIIDSIPVHGGITFASVRNFQQGRGEQFYIGWDYAHADDYFETGLPDVVIDGKKWTTEEMDFDTHELIDFITQYYK